MALGQQGRVLAWLLLLLLCSPSAAALADDTLIGWQGEQYREPGADLRRKWNMEVLSWSPRAFLFRNFLSEEEIEHMITQAKPQMQKSTVVDNGTGKSVPSNIRTSEGTFFRRQQDDIIAGLEARIAEASQIPISHGEGIQILKYEIGQKYESHYDFFSDKFNTDPTKGGQRIATMLMYLTSVEEGGETVFPASAVKPNTGDHAAGWSKCAQRGVAVKAKRGDAMLFWSLKPNGKEDTASLHAGCPVIRGTKWSATKWMHVGDFLLEGGPTHPPGECKDYNDNCQNWAIMGECTKNAPYMVGADGSEGECKAACKAC